MSCSGFNRTSGLRFESFAKLTWGVELRVWACMDL